ncbi:MAG: HAD family hydrolase [Hamadaea sp.]|uniref:HAD family hydrolase n=1 Tax=Hamadaea sp. TaxID=2024425 RepID=UPI001808C355|nr:HAD-IA family hydrolase [Hamadaea sp.]NUR71429.1 HAD family hydrolase [Hamadaea sp.]NUT23739.1 HAD family hydrolase [Hamadaea sp.]
MTPLDSAMIRAVVIDVDDTLCLTEAVCFALENEVLSLIGAAAIERAVHRATWGQPLLTALPIRSPGVDLARFVSAYPAVLGRYVAEGRLDAIVPENLTALDDLAAAGRDVYVLTSRTEEELRHLLDPAHALANRVRGVFHADNTDFGKPDPRAFDEFLAETGFCPSDCVYVGDSPGDADAALGAGLRFIACLQSGVRSRADFAGRAVDAYIPSFPDVVTAVAALELHATAT